MAEIIDLDFYRKFRVILPVRSTLSNEKNKKTRGGEKSQARRYYRRRKKTPHDFPTNHSSK